jgi:hypothetical protein
VDLELPDLPRLRADLELPDLFILRFSMILVGCRGGEGDDDDGGRE